MENNPTSDNGIQGNGLQERKKQLRLLAEEAEEYAIFLLDVDGQVARWNEGAKQLKGYTQEEILGTHYSVFFPPEDVQADVPEEVLEVAAAEGQWTSEGWRVRKDGSRYWSRERVVALMNEEGEVHGFATVTRDLTEQKEQEKALRQTEQRYRRLFETSQEGILLASPSGEIIDVNPALCELTGYDREELLGRQASTLYDDESREKLVQALQRDGRVQSLEVHLHCKDGEERICQVSATLWTDEDGDAQAVQSFVRDVTEEKEAKEALEESEARFRALAENSTVGTFVLQDGELKYVNEAFAQMYGYTPEELIGQNYVETLVHPGDRGRIRKKNEQRLSGEVKSLSFRFRGLTKEGEAIYVQAYGSRIDDCGGPAILGTDIDVSERTCLQRDVLQVQEAERRRLGRDLHDVVASQLTGVGLILGSLSNQAESEELAERIEEVRDLVVESTEDIRQLSRGLTPAGLSDADLPAALERLADNTTGCRFDCDEAEADSLMAELDEDIATHLYCIAQEALANARKYADAESILLRLRHEKGAVVLVVEDDGKGFAPSSVEKDDSLGLRSMRYRAELIGAELSIDSTPGSGTVVRCRLPL